MKSRVLISIILLTFLSQFISFAQHQNLTYVPPAEYEEFYESLNSITGMDSCAIKCQRAAIQALEAGDSYALCLAWYVEMKHFRKLNPGISDYSYFENFVQLANKLINTARENGCYDILFYAYFDDISYHLMKRRSMAALEIANNMHADALKCDYKPGLYLTYRAFITISTSRHSQANAQRYLSKAIDYALKYLPEESVSSMCMSRVNYFPAGSDSSLYYLNLVEKHMLYDEDTTFVYRQKAYYAAQIGDREGFEKYRTKLEDYFINHKHKEIPLGTRRILEMYENELAGNYAVTDSIVRTFVNGKAQLQYIYDFSMARRDSSSALAALLQLDHIDDSSRAASSDNDILELAARFDVNNYKQQINDQEVVISNLEKRNTWLAIVFFIFTVAVVLAILLLHQIFSNKALKKASDMKTSFIQNMSHEIRTPLNSIVGFSQLLSMPDGFVNDVEKEEYSRFIVNNSNMLTMLIDDILNLADIERGNYNLIISDTRVSDILDGAMNVVSFRVPEGVELRKESDMDAAYSFCTDGNRIQQVLINFLTNACKHTEAGEIVLRASLEENPGMMTFSVRDTGTGVPEDKAEEIFNRFTKLDSFAQGNGLGLNICRIIAHKLGGECSLDTGYKGGARFIFTVPLVQPIEEVQT